MILIIFLQISYKCQDVQVLCNDIDHKENAVVIEAFIEIVWEHLSISLVFDILRC
jgi:hypothetical protein